MFRASLIFCILLISNSVFASMYFEPVVGYGFGSSKISTTSTSSADAYLSPSVGFKFGYFVKYVYVVTDFRYSILNIKESPSESSPALTNMGLGIGWDWNIPIRTFIGIDFRASTTISDNSLSGSAQRFALGYYLDLDTLLSLEFISSKMSADVSGTDIEFTYSQTMVTFSFPIEFMYPQTSWKDKVRK